MWVCKWANKMCNHCWKLSYKTTLFFFVHLNALLCVYLASIIGARLIDSSWSSWLKAVSADGNAVGCCLAVSWLLRDCKMQIASVSTVAVHWTCPSAAARRWMMMTGWDWTIPACKTLLNCCETNYGLTRTQRICVGAASVQSGNTSL